MHVNATLLEGFGSLVFQGVSECVEESVSG